MICKRCGATVAEDVQYCPCCGGIISKDGTVKKTMGLLFLVGMVILCGVYLFFRPNWFETPEEIPIAAATNTPQSSEAVSDAVPQEPDATADLSKMLDDVFDMLTTVYEGTIYYCGASLAERPFVSRNGFLYHRTEERLVTAADVAAAGLLGPPYAGETVFLLYIAPAALADYEEVRFTGGNDLQIFTAYETKDGVALVSGDERGVLYREHYNALVAQYAYLHGEIVQPDAAAADYQGMLDAVISYDMITDAVYVRYAATDDRYGVIVLSEAGTPNETAGYVLERTEGRYAVLIGHFEAYALFQAEINNRKPDLNLELLPLYSLYEETPKIRDAFPALIAKLRADGVMAEEDTVVFSSGNDRYAYVVLGSGQIMLGALQPGAAGWVYTPVTNWLDAALRLAEAEPQAPPTYILWQR